MKDHKVNKQSGVMGGLSPVAAAVAGAVVGAGIAVAGVALSDKKNREKVKRAALKVKEDVVKYAENVKNQGGIKKLELDKKHSKINKVQVYEKIVCENNQED